MEIIKVEDVSLTMQKTEILKNINITFETGQIYGLVGRNGSGKTMLMKCICGFVRPTKGSIFVGDKKIGQDLDFIEYAGIIIVTPGFIPYYSGLKNLMILAGLNKKITKEEVKKTMEQVGLNPKLKRYVGKYSLGMRQRLGIAQAIMEEPDILILDDPMTGLDNQGVEDIRKILLEQKEQGKTIIISSHNREDIDILCDQVWEMNHGIATEI